MYIGSFIGNFTGIDEYNKWLFLNFIFSVFFAYIDSAMFVKIFGVETEKKRFWLFILCNMIIRLIVITFIPAPYYRALNIICSIIIFKFFFGVNIEKCILGEVINAITTITSEAIFSKMFCVIFNDVETYLDGIYDNRYIFCLRSSILVFKTVVYLAIKKLNVTIHINNGLEKKNKCKIIIVSIIGCMLIFFNVIEMTMYITDFPYSIFLLDIFSLVFYFFIAINSVMRISVLEDKEMEIHNLEAYNNTLSIMYDSIRSFKHDFFNFVQSINGYAQIGDIYGIKHMNQSILKDCNKVNQLAVLDPKLFNNPAVYSIVNNKYYLARKNDVEFSIEILDQPSYSDKFNYEFCRILGILLDNAIEAAMECEDKRVNLKFLRKDNKKIAIVENTYKNFDFDIEKIFEKGFSTKNKTKSEHGLGLWNVKNIIKHNKAFNLVTTKSNFFKQCLEVADE